MNSLITRGISKIGQILIKIDIEEKKELLVRLETQPQEAKDTGRCRIIFSTSWLNLVMSAVPESSKKAI